MNIKQTADASGVSARNIRYYEQAGLLAPARNPENDYRIYTDADVRTLKLIRVLRTLDMPVEDIRAVLSGTLPLTEAAERQRRQLEAEQQKLAAAEHKRQFTFTPDTAIGTPQDFTAALLAWADENGVDVNMTRESMTPHFMLDGIEYRAVRYSSHVRNIPILRVRCEVCDPSALAVEGDPKRLRVQRFLHYGLPVLVCLALAVVWVCTRNMPLWPDKAAMLLVLGALGIGYGFRGWYLYYNDRDQ